ncbi:Protein of unknown function [Kaistella treverensis]|uniref:Uncharacterized protein n=1 Tax=Kaistella treverensis TaxID=631455 RepID=A0A1I3JGQ5_9FLAO|nr:DUF1572 family protein [Kaistella treverensis]SFI59346.1 Protein of unknown function [Kaistella treverensis]
MKEIIFAEFQKYKYQTDEIFSVLNEPIFFKKINDESKTITDLVQDFAEEFGTKTAFFSEIENEKIGQNSSKFLQYTLTSKAEVLQFWSESWEILFKNIEESPAEKWEKFGQITGKKSDFESMVLSQLSSCAFSVGQIIFLAELLQNEKNSAEKIQTKILFSQKPENTADLPENSSPVCFAKSDEVRDEYKI